MGAARLLAGTRRRGLPLRRGGAPPDPRDRGPLPPAAARPRLLRGRHERARGRATPCRSSTPASRCASGSTSSPTRWATCPSPRRSTRRARKGDRAAVLELDHRSFDGFWRLDADGLTNAIEATPSSRFRVADGDDGLRRVRGDRARRPPRVPPTTRRPSRRAPCGIRAVDRARRVALAAPPRRDPGAGQHPARQRAGARALRVVRVPRAAGRALRHGSITVKRARAIVGAVARARRARCRGPRRTPRRPTRRPRRRSRASRCSSSPRGRRSAPTCPLRLAITGPLGGLEARAIVHSSMTSRTGFERTVDGERLGSTDRDRRRAGRDAARSRRAAGAS